MASHSFTLVPTESMGCYRTRMLFVFLYAVFIVSVEAFSGKTAFFGVRTTANNNLRNDLPTQFKRHNTLIMRDASASYWFKVGDTVKVIDDVYKSQVNLKNRIGRVIETWEKCDVDPTCCCAEQVDIGMAVRVEFTGTEANANDVGSSFVHYFAEAELEKEQTMTTDSVAFDGMTCTAFKLEHLKMGKQQQRLAEFEATRKEAKGDDE